MRNIKDSTFPENILEEIGINKVSEKKIDYSRLTDDQVNGLLYAISQMKRRDSIISVSYTHLTLPTILLV